MCFSESPCCFLGKYISSIHIADELVSQSFVRLSCLLESSSYMKVSGQLLLVKVWQAPYIVLF